jgi:hypothetical protein
MLAIREEVTAARGIGPAGRIEAFIDEALATPAAEVPEVPEVPWRGVTVAEGRRLDAVDLAWLDRLPSDPGEMSEAQVVELARLAQQVALGADDGAGQGIGRIPGATSRDQSLVEERWGPVRQHFEAQRDRARLVGRLAEAGVRVPEGDPVAGRAVPPAAPAAPRVPDGLVDFVAEHLEVEGLGEGERREVARARLVERARVVGERREAERAGLLSELAEITNENR